MKDWKIYIQGMLKKTIVHWLEEYFHSMNIHAPGIEDFKSITEKEVMNSWLSIPSQKDLLIFVQTLKNESE